MTKGQCLISIHYQTTVCLSPYHLNVKLLKSEFAAVFQLSIHSIFFINVNTYI